MTNFFTVVFLVALTFMPTAAFAGELMEVASTAPPIPSPLALDVALSSSGATHHRAHRDGPGDVFIRRF